MAYELVYFYYELVCDYYYMVYVKMWVSEMFYYLFYFDEVCDVVVFKVYSIIEEYLVVVRDMFLYYLLVLMNMSFYFGYKKDYECKLFFCYKVKDVVLFINGYCSYNVLMVYNNLGVVYGGCGNWSQVLNFLDIFLSILLELGRWVDIFYVKNNIVYIYVELGDFERVIFMQEEVVEVVNED